LEEKGSALKRSGLVLMTHRLFSHDPLRLLFGVAMFASGVLGGGVFAGEDYPFFLWASIIFLVLGVMAISSWLTGVDPEIWVRE
jgi:hypothetical protein